MRDVVIIGAGQAGLGLSYCLTQQGVDHVILEKGDIGRAWREDRWDSFCLVTPNWTITLPGAEYAGDDPGGFMDRDDFVRNLEAWAKSFDAPIQSHTEVLSVAKIDAGFKLETTAGPLESRRVVLACATYQHPRIPGFAAALDPEIQQVHAAGYRAPAALPPGGVLVVGSGQSGCQIAEELNRAGRKTALAVGDTGRLPRRYRGRDCIDWQNDIGLLDRTPDMLDSPAHRFRGDPHLSGARGGHTLSPAHIASRWRDTAWPDRRCSRRQNSGPQRHTGRQARPAPMRSPRTSSKWSTTTLPRTASPPLRLPHLTSMANRRRTLPSIMAPPNMT